MFVRAERQGTLCTNGMTWNDQDGPPVLETAKWELRGKAVGRKRLTFQRKLIR